MGGSELGRVGGGNRMCRQGLESNNTDGNGLLSMSRRGILVGEIRREVGEERERGRGRRRRRERERERD